MVGEAVVLLRVEHFQQRRRRVAAPVVADLVDLVQDDDRVARLGVAQGADDAAGDGPDVGAAVAANFGLVAHAAQADAHHLAPHGPRHRGGDRRLADAGRPVEVDDGALHVLAGQLAHGHVLDNALLHVFQTIMIFVEHLTDVGDVKVVLSLVVPGQLGQPLQVGANNAGLGRLPALILQALQLA